MCEKSTILLQEKLLKNVVSVVEDELNLGVLLTYFVTKRNFNIKQAHIFH